MSTSHGTDAPSNPEPAARTTEQNRAMQESEKPWALLLQDISTLLRRVEQAFHLKIKLENKVIVKQVFQVEDLLLTHYKVGCYNVKQLKSS